MNTYDLRFFDPFGNLLYSFDIFIELEYGRQKNDIGACSLLIPGNLYDVSTFKHDSFLEIWRYDSTTNSMKLIGDTVYFLAAFEYSYNKNGEVIELIFFDTISLLSRRYNLWLLSEFTDYPSHMFRPIVDQMIQIFNHNFGNNTQIKDPIMSTGPAGNDPTVAAQAIGTQNRKMDLIHQMLIPSNINSESFDVANAFENCLEIFQNLANLSESRNIPVWFDVVYTPSDNLAGNFKFQIWEGLRGSNHAALLDPKTFNLTSGNFENAKLTVDYRNYANAIVVISDELEEGDTEPYFDEIMQNVALSDDYTSLPFYPIELVIEQRKAANLDSLQTLALSKLAEKRPIKKLTGDIINVPGYQFGIDFNYGDLVIVDVKNLLFTAEISKFNISVNRNGEKISIPIESTTLL